MIAQGCDAHLLQEWDLWWSLPPRHLYRDPSAACNQIELAHRAERTGARVGVVGRVDKNQVKSLGAPVQLHQCATRILGDNLGSGSQVERDQVAADRRGR